MRQHDNNMIFAVICIENSGCEDLEIGKVYRILPDESAGQDDYLRIIDESGEDYLYPKNYFVSIELPEVAQHALFHRIAA